MKLYRVSDNEWIFQGKTHNCQTIIKALVIFGTPLEEIEYGLNAMIQNEYHIGDLGALKGFTFFKKIDEAA